VIFKPKPVMKRISAIGAVFLLSLVFTATIEVLGQTTATLAIPANQPGAVVNSNLYGIYFEEINFADDETNGWDVFNGTWNANTGLYQQTAITTDCYSTTGNTNWAN